MMMIQMTLVFFKYSFSIFFFLITHTNKKNTKENLKLKKNMSYPFHPVFNHDPDSVIGSGNEVHQSVEGTYLIPPEALYNEGHHIPQWGLVLHPRKKMLGSFDEVQHVVHANYKIASEFIQYVKNNGGNYPEDISSYLSEIATKWKLAGMNTTPNAKSIPNTTREINCWFNGDSTFLNYWGAGPAIGDYCFLILEMKILTKSAITYVLSATNSITTNELLLNKELNDAHVKMYVPQLRAMSCQEKVPSVKDMLYE
jgi:hypothetical protein